MREDHWIKGGTACGLLCTMLLAISLAIGAVVSPALAFIQTGSHGVYQTADGKLKIVVSANPDALGLFIVYFENGIPLQEFNPEKLPQKGASHIFLRLNPAAEHPFHEIQMGEKIYKVGGNFSINIGTDNTVQIDVDNLSSYATIRYKEKSDEHIIGFAGLTEVVKGQGDLAAVVAANQLDTHTKKIIRPYTARDGQLWLSGNQKKPVDSNVGVYVKRDNQCLKSEVVTMTAEQIRKVRSGKDELERGRILSQYLKDNAKASPTRGTIVIKADKRSAFLLDIATKNILDLKPIEGLSSKQKICVLTPLS
jgi:hypothetical protein